jgi:hypothetical protein
MICRGGDDTQRGLNAEPPLESPGAATSNVILHSAQYFDVTAMKAHPCATVLLPSSMMAIREYCASLRRLKKQT